MKPESRPSIHCMKAVYWHEAAHKATTHCLDLFSQLLTLRPLSFCIVHRDHNLLRRGCMQGMFVDKSREICDRKDQECDRQADSKPNSRSTACGNCVSDNRGGNGEVCAPVRGCEMSGTDVEVKGLPRELNRI